MSHLAVSLILSSAVIHAGWNLIAKGSSPSAVFFLVANTVGALVFAPWVIAFREVIILMPSKAWILLGLAAFFQGIYCVSLAAAYRHGELSLSYPISRSFPVMAVPLVSVFLGRGGQLVTGFWAGTCLILAGGALVSAGAVFSRGARRLFHGPLAMAMWAGAAITGYSLIDDHALRILRTALGDIYPAIPITLVYAFLEAIVCGLWIALFISLRPGSPTRPFPPLRGAVGAGILMHLTYGLVLISMAYARDVSYIVAFRQVSILIGAAMGIVFLKERADLSKVLGLLILFSGVVMVASV